MGVWNKSFAERREKEVISFGEFVPLTALLIKLICQ
jgi:hypothetical protein